MPSATSFSGNSLATVIVLSVLIPAPMDAVWAAISDLASHTRWMADAESIEFEAGPTQGVGTRLRVATRIGPLRTVDMLEVVEWIERRRISVVHSGVVSGRGSFDIVPLAGGTRLRWRERLVFPWWLGGPVTAWVAGPILARVWRGNLARLCQEIEGCGYSPTA